MTDTPMAVKVKPLVWEEAYDSHPWGWKARCAIMGGFYYADNVIEKQQQDALRASRILAALDMTPDPRVTALVEAAEKMVSAYREETDGTISAFYALDAALDAFKGDAQ